MLKHFLSTLVVLACATLSFAADDESSGTEKRVIGGFVPLVWPCLFGIGLYGLTTALLVVHFFRTSRCRYMLTLIIGMLLMTMGFALRIYYSKNLDSIMIYAVANSFIILPPCFFLANNYVLLSHLALALGEDVSSRCLLIRRTLLVKIFLGADIITFIIQGGAGGMSASGGDMANLGEKMMLVGLILQVVTFGLFVMVLAHFGFKVRSNYPGTWHAPKQRFLDIYGPFKISPVDDWRQLYWVLAFTSVCILIRCTFRIIEFLGGYGSYLATHEGYFYALDALPLLCATSAFVFLWPERCLSEARSAEHQYAGTSNMEMGKQRILSRDERY